MVGGADSRQLTAGRHRLEGPRTVLETSTQTVPLNCFQSNSHTLAHWRRKYSSMKSYTHTCAREKKIRRKHKWSSLHKREDGQKSIEQSWAPALVTLSTAQHKNCGNNCRNWHSSLNMEAAGSGTKTHRFLGLTCILQVWGANLAGRGVVAALKHK